ncbi:MAG: sporulation protein YqfD [Thermovenabulum sp.]|uniref:sporulation protein YqfD n=1 Tax=Thermovenabulum sp. TaxID=3100335 RepID=UPI003C7BB433
MFLFRLWNCFGGYVIIKIKGEYVERLLNQASLNNILLWDVKKKNEQELEAKIDVRGFFELVKLSKKVKCRIIVVKKVGFYFSILRLKKRSLFAAGTVIFIILLYVLSSFIWAVQVNVNDDELKQKIIKDLQEWGIKPGVIKYNIDKKYVIDKILLNYKNISWVELYVKGTRVVVEVVPKEPPPLLKDTKPCNIVASKDGVIEEVITLNGEPKVKRQDFVTKGDILISGRIPLGEGKGEILVPAEGIVKAKVWYQRSVKVPIVKITKEYTGRERKILRLKIKNNELYIYFKDIDFNKFDEINLKSITLLPKGLGDVKGDLIIYREYKDKKEFVGVEGAKEEAQELLEQEIKELSKNKEIVKHNMEFYVDNEDNSVIGILNLELIEDIGQKEIIQ